MRLCNSVNFRSLVVLVYKQEKQNFLQKRFRIALKIQIEKTSNRRSYAAAPPVTFLNGSVLVGNKLSKYSRHNKRYTSEYESVDGVTTKKVFNSKTD